MNLNDRIINRQPELLAAFYDEVALRLAKIVITARIGRQLKRLSKY